MKRLLVLLPVLIFVASLHLGFAEGANRIELFNHDDWVTYKDFRFIRFIQVTRQHAYFASSKGILIYDLWHKEWKNPLTTSDGLPSELIGDVKPEEDRDRIWVKTDKGIHYYSTIQKRWGTDSWEKPFDSTKAPRPSVTLTTLFINRPYFYDGKVIKDGFFRAYPVTHAVTTENDDLLIATRGLGAAIGSKRMDQAEMRPIGLWNEAVWTIGGGKRGRIWFGSASGRGGLSYLDPETNRWDHIMPQKIEAFEDYRIFAICDSDKAVYFGTGRGIMVYHKNKDDWEKLLFGELSNIAVTAIKFDKDLNLWIGTKSGLCQYNLKKEVFSWHINKKSSLPGVNCLLPTDAGLWVGTNGGLYRCNFIEKKVKRFSPKDSSVSYSKTKKLNWEHISNHHYLANRKIHSFFKNDTILWIGSEDGLVYTPMFELNPTSYGGLKTPLDGPVYAICRLKDHLWIGTRNGIIQIDPNQEQWVVFTSEDGLADNKVYSLLRRGNHVWCGTTKGVTRCKWRSIQKVRHY